MHKLGVLPRTPKFWAKRGFAAWSLLAFGLLYGLMGLLRQAQGSPTRAPIPVLCVGNALVGGVGKTPVAAALTAMLRGMGHHPHILSRGYGGSSVSSVPQRVDRQSAQMVGDEPILLKQAAPTWVAHDRAASAITAAEAGADVVLMDDGWQSPGLYKDINLLVVDGPYGIGNGWCLPAGPLREFWGEALARADAAVLLGDDKHNLLSDIKIPVFKARLEAVPEASLQFNQLPVLAFAGIGRPEKFFATLQNLGAKLVEAHSFADHHFYSEDELTQLCVRARTQGLSMVTTTKDWVRLSPEWQTKVLILPIHCVWENELVLSDWLKLRLLEAKLANLM